MLLHLLQQRGKRESLGEVEDNEAREDGLRSSISQSCLRGNPFDLLQEPTETRFQLHSQFGYLLWPCLGLFRNGVQNDLPPVRTIMKMLFMLPGEDGEVRPLIYTVSHDPNDHLNAGGVIFEKIQLSDTSHTSTFEPVSIIMGSLVDVILAHAITE